MEFSPIYIPFFKRSWIKVNSAIILLMFFSVLIPLMKNENIISLVLLCLGVSSLFFLLSMSWNKIYLKNIKFIDDENSIEFTAYRFNRELYTKKINIKDCNIRIQPIIFSSYPAYKLEILIDNKIVFTQMETGAWISDIFIIIVEYFAKLKGTKTYTKSVRKRTTLSKYFPNIPADRDEILPKP
jgi:hypothetical protein